MEHAIITSDCKTDVKTHPATELSTDVRETWSSSSTETATNFAAAEGCAAGLPGDLGRWMWELHLPQVPGVGFLEVVCALVGAAFPPATAMTMTKMRKS